MSRVGFTLITASAAGFVLGGFGFGVPYLNYKLAEYSCRQEGSDATLRVSENGDFNCIVNGNTLWVSKENPEGRQRRRNLLF